MCSSDLNDKKFEKVRNKIDWKNPLSPVKLWQRDLWFTLAEKTKSEKIIKEVALANTLHIDGIRLADEYITSRGWSGGRPISKIRTDFAQRFKNISGVKVETKTTVTAKITALVGSVNAEISNLINDFWTPPTAPITFVAWDVSVLNTLGGHIEASTIMQDRFS